MVLSENRVIYVSHKLQREQSQNLQLNNFNKIKQVTLELQSFQIADF